MDTLQATYDYSDNEEEDEQEQSNPSNQSGVDEEARRPFSLNSEAPKLSELLPKPSNLFSSLPQPKSSSSSSSLFSSLPPPTSRNTDASHPSPAQSAGKRIVQFRPPPVNPVSSGGAGGKEEEKDDDDYEDDKRKKKEQEEVLQTASVKSFLSSIPAPRNTSTLGVSSSGLGTGRRSIIDADVRGLKDSSVATGNEAGFSTNAEYYDSQYGGVDQISVRSSGGIVESSGYGTDGGIGDYSNWAPGTENYAGYVGVSGYYQDGDYTNYVQYGNNGTGDSAVSMASGLTESSSVSRASGRRGRDTIPEEIVEVKQDELMKNRPREDQVKLTGVAFGPSYQPASTKGKPSKLHKRKHQIGSLYFDMKQKEMELEERRARGFLTKAQTQGKYGW